MCVACSCVAHAWGQCNCGGVGDFWNQYMSGSLLTAPWKMLKYPKAKQFTSQNDLAIIKALLSTDGKLDPTKVDIYYEKYKDIIEEGLAGTGGDEAADVSFEEALTIKQLFYDSRVSMNIDLTNDPNIMKHAEFVFDLINNAPEKMFDFAYVFNNSDNSPFLFSVYSDDFSFSSSYPSSSYSSFSFFSISNFFRKF